MKEIASRYATALYSLASDTNNVASWQDQCKVLNKILNENYGFVVLLNSEFLTKEERIELLNKTLSSFDKEIISLLKILIENNRVVYIFDILEGFNSLCNESRGVKEGLLYSSSQIDEETKHLIENKISEKEKVTVELINRIDPSLIGGVKVVIDNHVYDGSIKNQIEIMRNTLLKKGDTNDEN